MINFSNSHGARTSVRSHIRRREDATIPAATGLRALLRTEVRTPGGRAFTLIELLVVIAIISILAALIFPVTGALNRKKMVSKARTELNLVRMAIDNYNTKLGHYPPDNPNVPALNQLYFELLGTTNAGTAVNPEFVTLDGSARIRQGNFAGAFGPGVQGFANRSATTGGDDARMAQRFLSDLKPAQVASFDPTKDPDLANVKLLICSVPSWYKVTPRSLLPANANPFRYNSSNPTNNPNSYDLWVDLLIAGKTNRISNWSTEPIIVATP